MRSFKIFLTIVFGFILFYNFNLLKCNVGKIEVICGPMFAGKTSELIRRLKQADDSQQKVLAIKHAFDVKRSGAVIKSHDGMERECVAIVSYVGKS